MKNAILYMRTACEQPSDTTYSLKQQDDILRTYCRENNINIVKCFSETSQARFVERTSFKMMINFIVANPCKVDGVLVTKWDRVAHSFSDAFHAIALFDKLKIEICCVVAPSEFDHVEWRK